MIPGLSKERIDEALQHEIHWGKGQFVLEQPIFLTRIDAAKVDDLLDFISRPDLFQDVAFGTNNLKLDSGKHIIIPAVIRTLIPSWIIEQYTASCNEEAFQPASERSLFRLFDVCSASIQKSIQGLDNFTAAGAQAFQSLDGVVTHLKKMGPDENGGRLNLRPKRRQSGILKLISRCMLGVKKTAETTALRMLRDPSESSTTITHTTARGVRLWKAWLQRYYRK